MAHESKRRLKLRLGGPGAAVTARKARPIRRGSPTSPRMGLYFAMLKRRR